MDRWQRLSSRYREYLSAYLYKVSKLSRFVRYYTSNIMEASLRPLGHYIGLAGVFVPVIMMVLPFKISSYHMVSQGFMNTDEIDITCYPMIISGTNTENGMNL